MMQGLYMLVNEVRFAYYHIVSLVSLTKKIARKIYLCSKAWVEFPAGSDNFSFVEHSNFLAILNET